MLMERAGTIYRSRLNPYCYTFTSSFALRLPYIRVHNQTKQLPVLPVATSIPGCLRPNTLLSGENNTTGHIYQISASHIQSYQHQTKLSYKTIIQVPYITKKPQYSFIFLDHSLTKCTNKVTESL